MSRWPQIVLFGLVSVLVLVAIFNSSRCRRISASRTTTIDNVHLPPPASGFLNLAAEVRYVGDSECAVCHSSIYRTFKETGMGRSFYLPAPDQVIEDYTTRNRLHDSRANLHYQMIQEAGHFYQLEYRRDEKGQQTHALRRKVDFIIGSGNHNRTYLTSENGFLFEMPVTWYSQKKIWDLSPGYHARNWRFSRPITPECMACHNSYVDHVPFSENQYREEVPLGIGCERCHGPGALHVAKRYATKAGQLLQAQVDSTIVNPRHLPLSLQLDVCLQCHLQGDMNVLKEGRKEMDFRPGMRLREVKSVFIRDQVPAGDFRIASHGARLVLSACFNGSDGRLVCTFCHNPHEPVQTLPRAFFNAKCLECHVAASLSSTNRRADHRAESDCVSCHMRQGATSDILHVNFTDHWIRREIKALSKDAADSLLRPENAPPVVLRDFFGEKDSAANLRLGIAYVRYFEAKHRTPEYLIRATPFLEDGLRQHPAHQNGRYALGMAYAHLRRFAEAQAQLQKLIELAPKDALAHFQLGQIMQDLQKWDEAAAAYENSLAIFADNAVACNNLGNVYATLGKIDQAIAAYERALQIQPGYAPAHNNLGDLYCYRLRSYEAAKKCFEAALRLDPDFALATIIWAMSTF